MIFRTDARKRAEAWPGRTGSLFEVSERRGIAGADAICERLSRFAIGFAAGSLKRTLGDLDVGRPEVSADGPGGEMLPGVGGWAFVEGNTLLCPEEFWPAVALSITGDEGPIKSLSSSSERSGVSERPSESLKLFSRAMMLKE